MAAPRSKKHWPSREMRNSKRFKAAAKALGLRVRQLRHERGWSLEKAGEAMKMDWRHLQKMEAGELNVTLVSLLRAAVALDVSLSDLFEEAGD